MYHVMHSVNTIDFKYVHNLLFHSNVIFPVCDGVQTSTYFYLPFLQSLEGLCSYRYQLYNDDGNKKACDTVCVISEAFAT